MYLLKDWLEVKLFIPLRSHLRNPFKSPFSGSRSVHWVLGEYSRKPFCKAFAESLQKDRAPVRIESAIVFHETSNSAASPAGLLSVCLSWNTIISFSAKEIKTKIFVFLFLSSLLKSIYSSCERRQHLSWLCHPQEAISFFCVAFFSCPSQDNVLFLLWFFMDMNVLSTCVSVNHRYTVPMEARRGFGSLWDCSCRLL